MKIRKISSRAFCIALVALLLIGATSVILPTKVFAANYKVSNGFSYELKGNKAYIIGYVGKSSAITIPQKINGKVVEYVELCGFKGRSINFSKCTGLKTFYAEQLYINTLDLRANKALTSLTIDESGGMKSLDLSKNSKLTYCYIYSNSMASLNLSGTKSLKKLLLFHCPITTLNLNACKSLTNLTIHNAKLTSLSLANNSSLKYVELRDNKLKTVNVGKNKQLKGLKFS